MNKEYEIFFSNINKQDISIKTDKETFLKDVKEKINKINSHEQKITIFEESENFNFQFSSNQELKIINNNLLEDLIDKKNPHIYNRHLTTKINDINLIFKSDKKNVKEENLITEKPSNSYDNKLFKFSDITTKDTKNFKSLTI